MKGSKRRGATAALFGLLVALCVAFWVDRPLAAQETWASRLGYPADQRVVILYAQGLGTSGEINEAVTELLEEGQLQSAGALAPAPWFDDAAAWRRSHPGADVGLSLTVTSTWPAYRWHPVAGRESVASLLDAEGFLSSSLMQFSLNSDAAEVQHEIEAQIQRAREAGLQPTHLVPYEGALLSRSDLLEIYLSISRKYWIPAMLVELTPEHIRTFREAGFPLSDEEVRLITNYPLPKLDDLRFSPEGDSLADKREQLFAEIDSLRPGITQIIFRPARESVALKRLTPDWQQRVWDAELLADPAVMQYLRDSNVAITSWQEMMQRFEGVNPTSIEEEEEAAAAEEEAAVGAASR